MKDMSGSGRDEYFMRMCLAEAVRGLGWAPPNPLVGCVIVKDGAVVSRGAHLIDGTEHAEQSAITSSQSSLLEGSTLYVNLEPCSHAGRTPPCTSKIIGARIAKVIWGENDSDLRSAGKAKEILESAGIETKAGVLIGECGKLNRVFHFKQRGGGVPYVAAKLALSADGKITARTGARTDISCRASRGLAHIFRQHFDAILIGAKTLEIDNPKLSVMEAEISAFRSSEHSLEGTFAGLISSGEFERRSDPVAVILDGNLRASPEMKVFFQQRECRFEKTVLLIVRPENWERRIAEFTNIDFVEILPVKHHYGKADWPELLAALYERGIYSLLVEGGGSVFDSLIESGLSKASGTMEESDKSSKPAFLQGIHIFKSPISLGEEGVGISTNLADCYVEESGLMAGAAKGQIESDVYYEYLFDF